MKKTIFILAAALFVLSCGAGKTEAQNSVPHTVEQAFAAAGIPLLRASADPVDFSLPLLEGGMVKLSALRGKIVFLNFWATWCPPCRAEMPAIESLHQRFADKGLEIIAVDCAEETAAVQTYITNAGYTFPVALDTNGKTSGSYGVSAIPTTYIIDHNGKIISRVVGSLRWDDPKLIAAFETLLAFR
jgi:thiol-disulfide isomerase/thioredoxin